MWALIKFKPLAISLKLCPPSVDKNVLISFKDKCYPTLPVVIICPRAFLLEYNGPYKWLLLYICKCKKQLFLQVYLLF